MPPKVANEVCDYCGKACTSTRTLRQHEMFCAKKRELLATGVDTKQAERIAELEDRVSFLLERNAFLEDTLRIVRDACRKMNDTLGEYDV